MQRATSSPIFSRDFPSSRFPALKKYALLRPDLRVKSPKRSTPFSISRERSAGDGPELALSVDFIDMAAINSLADFPGSLESIMLLPTIAKSVPAAKDL